MVVLVAGGAGLLGHAVARRLLDEGDTVVAADVFGDAGDGFAVTRERARDLKRHPRAAVEVADLTDPAAVERLFARHRPAAVVNAARFAPAGTGGRALRDAVRTNGTGLYVHLSSGALYGGVPPDAAGGLPPHAREDEELDPGADPALLAEAREERETREAGIPFVILRVFDPIGPGLPPARFPMDALEAILAGEEVVRTDENYRDLVHVEDVARGTVLALRRRPTGRTVNLGGGGATSIRWLIETMAGKAGRPLRLRISPSPDRPPRPPRVADLENAWSLLAYAPRHEIEETIDEIVGTRLGRPPARRTSPLSGNPRSDEPPRDVSRRDLFGMFRKPFGRGRG